MDLTRRDLLKRLGFLTLGGRVPIWSFGVGGCESQAPPGTVPLIHTTDLYHPPQDPDDQIDLATVCGLPEYDLKGVVLDITERFLHEAPQGFDIARAPGHMPVSQMAYLTGTSIPVSQGPVQALRHPGDTCQDAPREEQAGIEMILDLLADSSEPVTISVSGSPRALTAAFNREPDHVREKTRTVLLNAGSTGGEKVEWNVQLDAQAYVGLWRSELPIHWFPPGTEKGAFDPVHERGTFWRASHADLFRDLPSELQRYFAIALEGDRPEDPIRALTDSGDADEWEEILSESRNLWATASLIMGAGRALARTELGWRFLIDPEGLETWPWRLDPINASIDDDGRVSWEMSEGGTNRHIFGRKPGREFGAAMTEALNALLASMEIDAAEFDSGESL